MSQKIKSLLSFQSNIINTVSHELRTPLTRMQFELEYLTDICHNQKQKTAIDSLNEDMDELNTLVSELLEYAKADNKTPNLQLEELSINSFIQRWRLGYKIHENGVTINFIEAEQIYNCFFDERLVTRIMNNLAGNAFRYAKSLIRISYEQTEDYILIHIDDDGPGIPGSVKEHIFTPFVQTENTTIRGMEGFGLGLAIVQQIVSWHKGQVSVADSELGGARFSVALPKKVAADQKNA
jgi:two-component system sensor histidine kinase RstB